MQYRLDGTLQAVGTAEAHPMILQYRMWCMYVIVVCSRSCQSPLEYCAPSSSSSSFTLQLVTAATVMWQQEARCSFRCPCAALRQLQHHAAILRCTSPAVFSPSLDVSSYVLSFLLLHCIITNMFNRWTGVARHNVQDVPVSTITLAQFTMLCYSI
jgi:hypothetical protein